MLNNPALTIPNLSFSSCQYYFLTKNIDKSTHTYDDENYINNLKCIQQLTNLCAPMYMVNQVHGNQVIQITRSSNTLEIQKIDGDAMVTNEPNITLAIKTADCMPVLFIDDYNKVIGAAHAGWKGASRGVLQNTVSMMVNFGAQIERINAIIGPCIRQPSYEVDQTFRDNFIITDSANSLFFIDGTKPQHYLFDLPSYAKYKLSNAGIKQIYDVGYDTFKEEELFFSYRRNTLNNINSTQRMLSIISLV
jgi:YfiH family protein